MKAHCAFLALFLFPLAAFADSSTFSATLTGTHSAQGALPLGESSWATGYSGSMKAPTLDQEFGLEASQGPVKAVSRWELSSTAGGTEVRNLEGYVSWSPDSFRLAFGNQVFAWGSADGRNPTDNLNPKDYRSVAGQKIRKLPVLSASAIWYPNDELSLEAVLVPVAGTSLFPSDAVLAFQSRGLTAHAQAPAPSPESLVTGAKFSARTSEFDAAVSYLYDIDGPQTPVRNPDFSVSLERHRIQRFGLDLKTTIDRFGLWAEGAFSHADQLSRFDYTTGLDFTFGPADTAYLNLQYAGTWVPDYDNAARTLDIQEGLLHSLIVSSHWNLAGDTLVPSLAASYTLPTQYDSSAKTRYGSLLLKPELDFVPVDSFHVTLGAVIGYAWKKDQGSDTVTLDPTDGAGVYTSQNNLSLTVSYKWNASLAK